MWIIRSGLERTMGLQPTLKPAGWATLQWIYTVLPRDRGNEKSLAPAYGFGVQKQSAKAAESVRGEVQFLA